MANEVQAVESGARVNHTVFRDVYNTTYDKDVIVDFEMKDGKPTGRCQTEKYGWLPVFYHCKKHCYDESARTLQANQSLKGGVLAFEVEDEVKVLIEEGTPRYIVGHFEQHSPPCMCKDIFRIGGDTHNGGDLEKYFVASAEKVLEGGVDFYGNIPPCERKELLLHQYWKVWSSHYYTGDRYSMLRVGPMLYVFVFAEQWHYEESYYWWGPDVYSYGAWTQEKEDALVAAGLNAEEDGSSYSHVDLPDGGTYLSEFGLVINEELNMQGWIENNGGIDVRTLKIYGQSDE